MTWDQLYAFLCVETGMSWEYIDEEMTLPRLRAFRDVWDQAPPVRVSLHALLVGLGGGGKAAGDVATGAARREVERPDLQTYLDAFGSAGLSVRVNSHVGRRVED